jgi:hypothetical protein
MKCDTLRQLLHAANAVAIRLNALSFALTRSKEVGPREAAHVRV